MTEKTVVTNAASEIFGFVDIQAILPGLVIVHDPELEAALAAFRQRQYDLREIGCTVGNSLRDCIESLATLGVRVFDAEWDDERLDFLKLATKDREYLFFLVKSADEDIIMAFPPWSLEIEDDMSPAGVVNLCLQDLNEDPYVIVHEVMIL